MSSIVAKLPLVASASASKASTFESLSSHYSAGGFISSSTSGLCSSLLLVVGLCEHVSKERFRTVLARFQHILKMFVVHETVVCKQPFALCNGIFIYQAQAVELTSESVFNIISFLLCYESLRQECRC